jgi:N-acetylglucosaminyl-diphospho-decaprenol L-rhamnosyltransferase
VAEARGDVAGVAADITVVIVTYNSAGILPWSLPVLAAHPHVVIVDNASADDTVAVAQRLLPQARVIEAGANLGFGRANNLGIRAADTPFVLVLNPDARLDAGALQGLADAAERWPEAAMLAPVLYDAPGVVGDFFRGPFARQARTADATLAAWHEAPAGDCCVEFVTGAAMLMRKRLMQRVLLNQADTFDPWFFLYHEDDELCARVRAAGLPIMVAAAASLEHQVRGSSAPSWRNSWRRSVCRTLSKLYLQRQRSGTAAWQREAWRIGVGSALALPFAGLAALVTARPDRVAHHAGRVWAAVRASSHLKKVHCFEPED